MRTAFAALALWPGLALAQILVQPSPSSDAPARPYVEPQAPTWQAPTAPTQSPATIPLPGAVPGYPSAPAYPTPQPVPPPEGAAPVTPPTQTPPPVPQITSEAASKRMIVDLAVIDKNLGRNQRLQVPMGRVVQYKTLEVMPERCVIDAGAMPRPQHALLLEVYDRKPHATAERVFAGWMLAGDPSLSHLAHPYYDVIVFGCTPQQEEAGTKEADDEDTKKTTP
jgi:hypothetical protein